MSDVAERADAEVSTPGSVRAWRRPPGRLFHLLLVVPALVWLWSWSVPGFHFVLWTLSVLVLGIGAVLWALALLVYLGGVVRGSRVPGGRWFLVAPACGLLGLALVIAGVPLDARWALSRPAFAEAVDDIHAGDDTTTWDDQRLGLYVVTQVVQEGEVIIFYERTGSLSDDAGFAYLPSGPSPELENGGFERPQFLHLGGPWYAWTASW